MYIIFQSYQNVLIVTTFLHMKDNSFLILQGSVGREK